MPRVPDHLLAPSLGAPGSAEGIGNTMLNTVKAAANFAGDLIDAGTTIDNVFKEQQKVANQKAVLEYRAHLQNHIADAQNEFLTLPPDQWVSRFDARNNDWKDQFLKADLPDEVRERIKQEANLTVSKARTSIASQALQKNLSDTRQIAAQQSAHRAARGDFTGAQAGLDEMHAAGLLDKPDYQAQSARLSNLAQSQQVRDLIDDSPVAAVTSIDAPDFLEKHPHLTLQDQDQLSRYAQQALNKQTAAFWEGVTRQALDPESPVILDAAQLQQLTNEGTITPTQAAAYRNAYHRPGEPAPDPALYQEAASLIRSYDPATDPDGYHLATLREQIGTLPLPRAHLGELSKLITRHASPEDSPEATPSRKVEKNFAALSQEYFNQGRYGGWFRMEDHDDNPATAEKKVITLDAYNRALAQKAVFDGQWEQYLKEAGPDLDPAAAAKDFEIMFTGRFIDDAASPYDTGLPAIPAAKSFDDELNQLIAPPASETSETPTTSTQGGKGKGPVYKLKHSSLTERTALFKAGGTPILLDSNWAPSSAGGKTSPLIVIPDNASTAQRNAAQAYVDSMASFLNKSLGRDVKGRVVTRSENGRGREAAFHTEPIAVTDAAALRLIRSPEGMKQYRQILASTIGSAPGATFYLPHSSKDPGAVANGTSEVELAKEILRGFTPDLPAGAMTSPDDQARRQWFQHNQPTNPATIAPALRELGILRSLHTANA